MIRFTDSCSDVPAAAQQRHEQKQGDAPKMKLNICLTKVDFIEGLQEGLDAAGYFRAAKSW